MWKNISTWLSWSMEEYLTWMWSGDVQEYLTWLQGRYVDDHNV